jgi:hypothetical protein
MRFRTTVELNGKTATGFQVPDEVIAALGAGKRPPVLVTIGDYTYRTTVAPMGGRFLIGINAQHRKAAGVAAGEEINVEIVTDTEPREVTVPTDLAAAIAADEAAQATFGRLSYTHRKEWVRWVEEAKKPETRATRLTKTVQALREGKRPS